MPWLGPHTFCLSCACTCTLHLAAIPVSLNLRALDPQIGRPEAYGDWCLADDRWEIENTYCVLIGTQKNSALASQLSSSPAGVSLSCPQWEPSWQQSLYWVSSSFLFSLLPSLILLQLDKTTDVFFTMFLFLISVRLCVNNKYMEKKFCLSNLLFKSKDPWWILDLLKAVTSMDST